MWSRLKPHCENVRLQPLSWENISAADHLCCSRTLCGPSLLSVCLGAEVPIGVSLWMCPTHVFSADVTAQVNVRCVVACDKNRGVLSVSQHNHVGRNTFQTTSLHKQLRHQLSMQTTYCFNHKVAALCFYLLTGRHGCPHPADPPRTPWIRPSHPVDPPPAPRTLSVLR